MITNKISYLTLVGFLLLTSQMMKAQKVIPHVSEVSYTDSGKMTNQRVSLFFIDTTTNKTFDTIDLAELNPFNKLPLKFISNDERFNKIYSITSMRDYEKLFPKEYREQWYEIDLFNSYDTSYIFEVEEIVHSTYEYTINEINGWVAICFFLDSRSKEDDNPNSAIGIIMVFDNKNKLVFTLKNTPGGGEMAISDDGRYLAYYSNCMGPDLVLINSYIEIIEIATNRVIFRKVGSFHGPTSGNYHNLIQFTEELNGGYKIDYYFVTDLCKIYSLEYSINSPDGQLSDIIPTGLIYKNKNGQKFFKEFERDLEIIDVK
jgi:hypothetical protein